MYIYHFKLVIIGIQMIELGGNIKLVGFKELDPGTLVVVKKIIGTYARKISDQAIKFQELSLHIKSMGQDKKNFELHGKLVSDSGVLTSEVTNYNLFFAMDKVLSNIFTQAKK